MSPSKKFLRYAHVSVVDTGVSCNNGETISCCLRSCIWHRHRGFLAELTIMLTFLTLQHNSLLQEIKKLFWIKHIFVKNNWKIWKQRRKIVFIYKIYYITYEIFVLFRTIFVIYKQVTLYMQSFVCTLHFARQDEPLQLYLVDPSYAESKESS